MTVDPLNLTKYNRTDYELQEMLLFSVFVAGKNAITTAERLDLFLFFINKPNLLPFESLKLHSISNIILYLKKAGIGCYNRKVISITQIINKNLDLRNCTVEELEDIYGIGPKTARMFVLHSRKDACVAVLDVHILRYMKDSGYSVPNSTPFGKKYKIIEEQFLTLAKASGKTIAEFDLDLWIKYSGRKKNNEAII